MVNDKQAHIEAVITQLTQQRNEAMNRLADITAHSSIQAKVIEAQTAEVAKLKEQLAGGSGD